MDSKSIMARHIVVDGLASNVTEAMKVKYHAYLQANFKKLINADFKLTLMSNDDGLVDVAFLEFGSSIAANRALETLNGYQLTKKDRLNAYKWEQFDQTAAFDDEYEEPEVAQEAIAADTSNHMMTDPDARPQFITRDVSKRAEFQWNWFNWRTDKVELYRKPNSALTDAIASWTEFDRRSSEKKYKESPLAKIPMDLPSWSPFGRFLLTRHLDGIRLWAGSKMSLILHVNEDDITNVQISPNEHYLVVKTAREFSLWSVRFAKKLGSLRGIIANETAWPVLKFNADDSLCAVVRDGVLVAYDTATMRLIRATPDVTYSYKADSEGTITTAEFSPRNPNQIAMTIVDSVGIRVEIDNIIVDFEEESAGKVAVALTIDPILRRNFLNADSPVFKEITEEMTEAEKETAKALNDVARERMFQVLWHPEGTHFAAKSFNTKTKLIEYSLFRIGQSTVTAQNLVINGTPVRFTWQPDGNLIAIIVEVVQAAKGNTVAAAGSADNKPKSIKTLNLNVYDLAGKHGVTLVGSLPTNGVRIAWAPKGARLVSTKIEQSMADMYSITTATTSDKKLTLNHLGNLTHQNFNHACWDPTGRFLATCTLFRQGSDGRNEGNRYVIWDINARELVNERFPDGLSLFAWRPMDRPILNDKEIAHLKNTLKDFIQKNVDQEARDKAKKLDEEIEKRKKKEGVYITKMEAIARNDDAQQWTERREALRRSSASYQRNQKAIAGILAQIEAGEL
eukprot:GILI01003864.1.p1 GENE.GILI01003864.1~~GILI01003864.1.p1  ORF type:complete len:738 (+),score=287.43 GILI01003864.1:49-2262(+)